MLTGFDVKDCLGQVDLAGFTVKLPDQAVDFFYLIASLPFSPFPHPSPSLLF